MADGTKIEWTDATWNPITGCSVHGPGCTNCYAMKLAGTRLQHHPSRAGLTTATKAGPVWNGQVRFNENWLTEPLRWKRPRRIFVVAHGDLFHEAVPDAWIDRVFAVMALCPQHQFQVLTKRADRMRAYFERYDGAHDHNCADYVADAVAAQLGRAGARGAARTAGHQFTWPLPNVWLGVSVEDRRAAEERIPHLLATPAAKRWISAEPLLGPLQIAEYMPNPLWNDLPSWQQPELDWVVAGGESGDGARQMNPDWVRSLRDQCATAGVPFLFKQWGAWAPLPTAPAGTMFRGTKKITGRLLDGVQHDGFPA